MPRTREIYVPTYFGAALQAEAERRTPTSPIEALMQAGAHDPIQESALEKHDRLQPLKDALEDPAVLTPLERWVVEAHIFRGLGFRQIAREIGRGKSHIYRIWKGALDKLEQELTQPVDEYQSGDDQ